MKISRMEKLAACLLVPRIPVMACILSILFESSGFSVASSEIVDLPLTSIVVSHMDPARPRPRQVHLTRQTGMNDCLPDD